jgi:carboxypeptidase C (cathepsin A)
MPEDTKKANPDGAESYEPPAGAQRSATWTAGGAQLDYSASGGWTLLRKKDKPVAEIFSVAYVVEGDGERPVTFVFNGGPGASSAFLHMGAVGPQRVAFPADGSLPRLPPRLVQNEDSWLAFTDLVFVDPVGTGFSRVVPDGREGEKESKKEQGGEGEQEFFGYKRDLESLCEFMGRWLSGQRRWGAPVFIAGESYGGYRVGRLARMLPEQAGIGLNGVILISPALEFGPLAPSDYDMVGWIDLLPTMALAAAHHGRSRAFAADAPPAEVRRAAEQFATGDYAVFLAGGAPAPEERRRILERQADLIGLPVELLTRAEGRVPITTFSRELLRDERRVLGLYDATITATDPFPDREEFGGPDPTLAGSTPAFTTAVNRQLRREIGVDTEREYVLLSLEVNAAWRNDAPEHFFIPPVGATDDLRYGLTLDPHVRAFVTHGRFDLVTPYFASDRLRSLMRMDAQMAERVTVRHFDGGHMFYAWEESRRAFSAAIAEFVAGALAQ